MTVPELNELWDEWSKKQNDQRFGQFVLNNSNLQRPNPRLFYEEDPALAYQIAYKLIT